MGHVFSCMSAQYVAINHILHEYSSNYVIFREDNERTKKAGQMLRFFVQMSQKPGVILII